MDSFLSQSTNLLTASPHNEDHSGNNFVTIVELIYPALVSNVIMQKPRSSRVGLYFYRYCSNTSEKNPKNIDKESKPKNENDNRELPEEPTNCCMSGCANCVWLDYAEKLSKHFKDGGEKAIKEINEKITDPNVKAFLLHELRMRYKKS